MQATVPHQPIKIPPPVQPPIQAPTIPSSPVVPQQSIPPQKRQTAQGSHRWLIGGGLALVGMMVFGTVIVMLGLIIIFNSGVLPGVRAAGVDVGGLSQPEAAAALATEWRTITVRDGDRRWQINPAELGVALNAQATAADAYAQGRGDGGLFAALMGEVSIEPRLTLNPTQLEAGLNSLADQVNVPAADAGITLVNGVAQTTDPRPGRGLNITATMAAITENSELSDGVLDLTMTVIQPTLTDATPILAQAQALLANPLAVRVYDPVSGDIVEWVQSPQNWATWLTASATGGQLSLAADPISVRAFLDDQSRTLNGTQYLNLDEATAQIQAAIQAGDTRPTIRIYHNDRTHTVRSGESIISIAWDYGVPYPWVQQANPGVDVLSVGQTLTIPSPDNFMPFAVVPDKRIVVNISQQNVKVYENGNLKWDWVASTGIQNSPTWPGVYQVISHVPNAYAANWNLHMPNFMGVYQPVPSADFTNGFHGFPTRGGGQLLWENSLGTRVTYGCILLSNQNVQLLYDWAETGVIVEIQP